MNLNKYIGILSIWILSISALFCQDTITIHVSGQCGMCKDRIENTSNKTKGVVSSNYSIEKQQLIVQYNEKFNKEKLIKALLKVGHDTEDQKATDEAYNSLHECCKYRNPADEADTSIEDDHDHEEQDHSHQSVLSGTVNEETLEGKNSPLIGANIYWLENSSIGTITDLNGHFELPFETKLRNLVVSYIGFKNDTLYVDKPGNILITMRNSTVLDEVTVAHRRRTTEYSFIDPIKIQQISSKELLKAACCTLAESFDTTPSIDGSMTDAVTGTRRIEMLGLAGPYIQITRENIPDARGLSAIQSLHSTPGPWVEGMQLNMGAGSVVNGFESMTGQINVELKKALKAEKMHFNIYGNQAGRAEFNHIASQHITEKLGTATFLHFSGRSQNRDLNKDGFMDMPKGNQFAFANRWDYSNPNNGHEAQLGFKVSYQNQISGQNDFDPIISNRNFIWGANSQVKRGEFWIKKGYIDINNPSRSIGLQFSGVYHDLKSMYGKRRYDGVQQSLYFNSIYQNKIGTKNHGIRTGISAQLDKFDEWVVDRSYQRMELVPGAFLDYTYKSGDKFTAVLGLRGDYHNQYGFFITPRLNMRYAVNEGLIFRVAGGRGQRTQSIFAENVGIFASNRAIHVESISSTNPYGLNAEVAYNVGANMYKEWVFSGSQYSLSIDFNHIQFTNKIIMDLERNQNEVWFYNLNGKAFSNSTQVLLEGNPVKGIDIKLAYRYNDVQTTYDGKLLAQPLISPHKAFANISFSFGKGFSLDYTINWLSSVRIPQKIHEDHAFITQSPDYFLSHIQISESFANGFEWYLGGENIFDYRIHDAIIAAHDPFHPDFDASLVWGPMMGRNIYLGLRYTIK